LPIALIATDAAVLVAAFVTASRLRLGPTWPDLWRFQIPSLLPVLAGYTAFVVVVLACAGSYGARLRQTWQSEVIDLLKAVALLVGITLSALYFFRLEDVSRGFLAMFFPLSAVGFIAARAAVRMSFRALRRRGHQRRNVLLVGTGRRAVDLLNHIRAHPDLGVRVVGYLGEPEVLLGARHLGGVDDLARVLTAYVVDEVSICLPFGEWATIELVSEVCEEQGKLVRIPIESPERVIDRGRLEHLEGFPVLTLATGPEQTAALALKRTLDVVGAGLALLTLWPLLAAIAVTIVITDGRPISFVQERVGLHGRRFRVYKFRTMHIGAEDGRKELEALNERSGPVFKIVDDPRITRTGRALRRSSLDELPQLWNVLKGDMSLVGPRPPMPQEVELYDLWHRRRLAMKPGMTGLWQVTARREESFDRWVELDLEYVDRWSLWFDLRILFVTLRAVARLDGS